MKNRLLIIIILMFLLINSVLKAQENKLSVSVDASTITHQMKGGIGALWHALIQEIPLNNDKYDYPVRTINPRGSAYAGNPPLTDTSAWNQLYYHAKMARYKLCQGRAFPSHV